MNDTLTLTDSIDIPAWDVALAGLARETFLAKGNGLKLLDFKKLATDYNIRLDDIMITMFQLAIHGEWRYLDKTGNSQPITQNTLDGLYVNRRLTELDLQDFDGAWQPVKV